MRKHLSFFLLSLLVIIGCARERLEVDNPSMDDSPIAVRIGGEIDQLMKTRVNDGGFCDGDAVGIYVVNYEDGMPGTLLVKGNQADNIRFVYEETKNIWTPDEPVYYKDKNTHADIYGYYPYSSPASADEFFFEVAKDQTVDAAQGSLCAYEASDFLWAKSADITPTTEQIQLNFRHLMASVVVELTPGTGWEEGEWETLEKEVLIASTVRKSNINLQTGDVMPLGDAPLDGIVPVREGAASFRAVVVPQTMTSGTVLLNITVGGDSRVYKKSADVEYVQGKKNSLLLKVSKKASSAGIELELVSESITPWENDNVSHDATAREYVIVDCPEAGKLEEILADKDYAKIKNLKVTGIVNALDFFFMRDKMTLLQSLNMKEAKIAAYGSSEGAYKEDEIPDSALGEKNTLVRFVFPDKLLRIGRGAFCGTNLSGSLIIPDGVEEIRDYAFRELSSLGGSLELPSTLKYIGYDAFAGCSSLRGTLNLPESLTYIGKSAFFKCESFSGSLVLPHELEVIEPSAFSYTHFSGTLEIPYKITTVPTKAFWYCPYFDGQLILNNNITEIGDGAFWGCRFKGTLNLPKSLLVIGEDAFHNNQFSGELVLPESLVSVKSGAFENCVRLTGIVKFPDEFSSISAEIFRGCKSLEGVIIPKYVESIGTAAFSGCYQLNSIICLATTPPEISSNAFSGVAKDNFTVEVPESAVKSYQTAPNWKEFKRFAAHREFSISRRLFRTLNASDSKTLLLRAKSGASWSIESKPDWVTVTPSSGTGKTDVTISVDELAKGAGSRSGEVVFLLDNKDYRSQTTVEQYDYAYGDGDVIKVQSATKGNGVNLVFMGDCYDAKDIADGSYIDNVNEAIDHFFDIEPYKGYRDWFNVYMIIGMSADSGVGDVNTIREARFGTQYTVGTGVAPNQSTCFKYALKADSNMKLSETLITLVLNTKDYGGITYMYGDGSAIAVCPMSNDEYPYDFRGIVQHEAGGHGFGKLADEYIYHNAFIQSCGCSCCKHVKEFNEAKSHGWYDNLSLSGSYSDVPWAHLLYDDLYQNTTDVYEGGYFHTRGVFRSEPNSCMNNNIPYLSSISRESIVRRLMLYAGASFSFDEFKANDAEMYSTATNARAAAKKAYKVEPMFPVGSQGKQREPVYMGEHPVLE